MIRDVLNKIEEEHNAQRIIGWCPLPKALDLAMLVFTLRPRVIWELGVFGGKSAIPMMLACKEVGQGVVNCCDPWEKTASQEGYDGENLAWWGSVDHDGVYRSFRDNLDRLQLNEWCRIHRMKSDDAIPDNSIDLIHYDSQHSEVVLRELKRFGSKLRLGGVAVLDDLAWTNSGTNHVAMAVEKLLKSGFIELYRTKTEDGYWGVYQRVR